MSTPKLAFMFSGQGSHYFRMGEGLYARHPTFRRWMDRLDVLVRDLAGSSVVEALYQEGRGKGDVFDRTLLTHPALLMMEYALAESLIEAGVVPDVVIGASLGTVAAACVAGCLDVEAALEMTIRHARSLEACCERGAMIAVLGPTSLYDDAGLSRHGELAAVNFDAHFVVAATMQGAAEIEKILRVKDIVFQRLAVSFAFHSRWLDAAEALFKERSRSMRARPARLPLVCCARTRAIDTFTADHAWSVAREPIRFFETMKRLEESGPYRYVDVGPSGTLATFMKYILSKGGSRSTHHTVLSPFGRDFERFTAAATELGARPPRPGTDERAEAPSPSGAAADARAAGPSPRGFEAASRPAAPAGASSSDRAVGSEPSGAPARAPSDGPRPLRAEASGAAATNGVHAGPRATVAFMFPGQGSQKRGMGAGLFDSVPEYAAVEREVDALLGYSMRALCHEDPDGRLKETQYTQPALYVVNALHYYDAIARGQRPDYVAGHSLGEYNALLAAGAFDLLTGLRLVKKRGELMAASVSGGMAAVIGMDEGRIKQVLTENGLGTIDVANFNSPSQIVISGPVADIARGHTVFEDAGARTYVILPVSAAFHSRYVEETGRAFADFIAPMRFEALRIPVISNVSARPYEAKDPSATIKSLLVQQITRPVQWVQSVSFLMAQGVKEFREIGPGNVLTRLVQQIERQPSGA
ncbi:malonyl CoA-acyl carrier protein transacylase [Sorangium cellulosum So ce56]|uniref:[acyl-carrier-protein] S-malonyltransferase n=2 Tax=Polyangiaceae TaxID=49 RepID=A9GJ47_SORC5|nr:malonyl CoA-acyl carrier protein transacylase [Sorangium cellulosum So ce56]